MVTIIYVPNAKANLKFTIVDDYLFTFTISNFCVL